jgi:hypothetical protein
VLERCPMTRFDRIVTSCFGAAIFILPAAAIALQS